MQMLEVVDNLEMSIDALITAKASVTSISEGIKISKDRAVYVLSQNGVELIKVEKGDIYDVNIHKAVDVENQESNSKNMYIKLVIKNGYKMNDKILRPALVIVEKR